MVYYAAGLIGPMKPMMWLWTNVQHPHDLDQVGPKDPEHFPAVDRSLRKQGACFLRDNAGKKKEGRDKGSVVMLNVNKYVCFVLVSAYKFWHIYIYIVKLNICIYIYTYINIF